MPATLRATGSLVATTAKRLIVAASPHIRGPASTPVIMWNVVASLVPVVAAATWFFGPSALLVIAGSVVGATVTEHWLGSGSTIGDGSAAITGVLLGLTLPAGLPGRVGGAGGGSRQR